MKTNLRVIFSLVTSLVPALLAGCSQSQPKITGTWDPKAAAAYLDQREAWWMGWQGAARDHGSFCSSCHTVLPYALSRPALRGVLGEKNPTDEERRLLDNVKKRVRMWKQIGPYYSDQEYGAYKTAESWGTEAVLNALILANDNGQQERLSEDTRAAFDNMWALQQKTDDNRGAWWWLQFELRPWEARDSQYFGAALAALAVGIAPENYRLTLEIQDNLELLRGYLKREYATQSLYNRMVLLWASTKLPGLIEPETQKSLIKEILSEQKADGGWSLSTLERTGKGSTLRSYIRSWIREDATLVEGKSDGCATGLAVFVLQKAGTPLENNQLERGLSWLLRNQNQTEGLWPASSLNKRRKPSSNIGRFMSDAATGYAVLALAEAKR
jgi:squalene-hopene/tetraprenyl-beta-curcumene cyclase